MDRALTATQEKQLGALERIIEQGLKVWFDVGTALLDIQKAKLYRATHATFEAYCKERWGFTRVRAHQLVDAAQVTANVNHGLQKPENERQARPLTKIKDPKEQRNVWKEAVKTAPEGKVTAAHVERIVSKHQSQQQGRKYMEQRGAEILMSQAEAIIRLLHKMDKKNKKFPKALGMVQACIDDLKAS